MTFFSILLLKKCDINCKRRRRSAKLNFDFTPLGISIKFFHQRLDTRHFFLLLKDSTLRCITLFLKIEPIAPPW